MYDITSRVSFANLDRWIQDARALASEHLVLVLVGNKMDREDDREVEFAEGERWAQENGESAEARMKGRAVWCVRGVGNCGVLQGRGRGRLGAGAGV